MTPLQSKPTVGRSAPLVSEKCPLCGHALTRHNSLGYCRTGQCVCDSTVKRSVARPRLPARSAKREAEMVVRRVLVAAFLTEHPVCQARLSCCTGRSVDVHERISRARGGSILDESIFVALCRACHTYITDNPAFAEEHGWALPSWSRKDSA